MRLGYLETMTDPAYLRPLAIAAEEVGFDAFVVPDSICYPEHSDSKYPYTADGNREFLEDKPFVETFTLIPYLAAVTERIRFTTCVVKLPLRHPVLMAKQVSSTAALIGDRLCFGIGLSPWPDDYEVVDVPWAGRGRRLDEMIDIIRGLCGGDYFSYDGEVFQVPSIKLCPVPDHPVPVVIGGHSDPALRRAARVGDGWIHAGGDPGELDAMLAKLADYRKEFGRENDPFEIHVFSADGYTVDGLKRLEDKGVTDVILAFRNAYTSGHDTQPLDDKLAAVHRFGETVIARLD